MIERIKAYFDDDLMIGLAIGIFIGFMIAGFLLTWGT